MKSKLATIARNGSLWSVSYIDEYDRIRRYSFASLRLATSFAKRIAYRWQVGTINIGESKP